MPDFDPADIFVPLGFYVLKTRCGAAEQKAWARVPCAHASLGCAAMGI